MLDALPPLGRAIAGLAIVSGVRAANYLRLRWRDVDETARLLTVREAIYDDVVSTPKTDAGHLRRTSASWSHGKGVSGKVVAQLMGHANVDTTFNVCAGARRVGAIDRQSPGGN